MAFLSRCWCLVLYLSCTVSVVYFPTCMLIMSPLFGAEQPFTFTWFPFTERLIMPLFNWADLRPKLQWNECLSATTVASPSKFKETCLDLVVVGGCHLSRSHSGRVLKSHSVFLFQLYQLDLKLPRPYFDWQLFLGPLSDMDGQLTS